MGILLVRHSDAIPGGGEIDDASRWLAASGRERARRVASLVRERGLELSRFVSSPRVRAVQTAEIFAQVLGFAGAVEIWPSLSFTQPAQRAAGDLASAGEHIAAFGHMPTIAEITALLVPSGPRSFAPSEAVWIESRRVVWSVSDEA